MELVAKSLEQGLKNVDNKANVLAIVAKEKENLELQAVCRET